jgi:Branched-chain polyamine synthase A C-terminal domain
VGAPTTLSPGATVEVFRREATAGVGRLLASRPWPSLDALTCASRYSLRIVLLALIEVQAGDARDLRRSFGFAPGPEAQILPPGALTWLADPYRAATKQRPWPALMWGQRRLVTESALERANWVISNLPPASKRIVFLGDDDLVAPLVAATAPKHDVVVCDIDPMVLSEAEAVATALSAQLTTRALDLSTPEATSELNADVVVADPFPSGDGSFEGFFWQAAGEALSTGGLLMSTLAPSHKPREYAKAAWDVLAALGFRPLSVAEDRCRYEVFPFELAKLERDFLTRLGQKPTIFHTKDTFVAELLSSHVRPVLPRFSYDEWQAATGEHYLTDFARRAGRGARLGDGDPAPAGIGEPTLEQLWKLAHQSWTRVTFRAAES